MHHLAPSAWKLAKAELLRVSPNQIGHCVDDKDDEANQTHLKQSVLERDAYLHCAQCCYVMIDRKASVQLTCGRHAAYLVRQLYLFEDGSRSGPSEGLMHNVVERLTDADMMVIAAYVASLQP
jgi:cytochrome c553